MPVLQPHCPSYRVQLSCAEPSVWQSHAEEEFILKQKVISQILKLLKQIYTFLALFFGELLIEKIISQLTCALLGDWVEVLLPEEVIKTAVTRPWLVPGPPLQTVTLTCHLAQRKPSPSLFQHDIVFKD